MFLFRPLGVLSELARDVGQVRPARDCSKKEAAELLLVQLMAGWVERGGVGIGGDVRGAVWKSGFESFDGAVSASFDMEDPFAGENASPLQCGAVSHDPGFGSFKSSDFGVHSCAPFFGIRGSDGLARGFGFNRLWWPRDSSLKAEDVKSGETGAVPLIAAVRWTLVVHDVVFSPGVVSVAVALELADGEIFVEDDVACHDHSRGVVVKDGPGMVLKAGAEVHAPTGAALKFSRGRRCGPILHHAAPNAEHGDVALVASKFEVRGEVVGVGGGAEQIVETDSVMHGIGPKLRVNVALLQKSANFGHEGAVGALRDSLLGMSIRERELVDDSFVLHVCRQLVAFELCDTLGLPEFEGAARLGLGVGMPDFEDVIRLAPVRDVGHPDEVRIEFDEGEGVFFAIDASLCENEKVAVDFLKFFVTVRAGLQEFERLVSQCSFRADSTLGAASCVDRDRGSIRAEQGPENKYFSADAVVENFLQGVTEAFVPEVRGIANSR
ncbi:unnamed protein product [Closterium sp. NIES-54]